MQKTQNRYTKLDGLRGLLSLVVALNHSFLIILIPQFANVWGQNIFAFNGLESKLHQIFMMLGNGGVAVTMFFVLSGFVMGRSLTKIDITPLNSFWFFFKRLARLYPAYLFLIVISALYMKTGFVYKIYPFATHWLHWWMNFEMTVKEFLRNVFFVSISLGGVTWTLRVIVIASLVSPLFASITKRTNWLVDLLLTFLLLYMSFTVLNIEGFRDLRYLYMFFGGQILPKFKPFFEKIKTWFLIASLPIAMYLLLDYRYMTNEYLGGAFEALVSWFYLGIMAYNTKTKLFNFLDNNILQYFGKISYSLYLVHFTVLYILVRLLFDAFPNLPYTQYYLYFHLTFFVITTAIATGLSALVNKYIESPSLKLTGLIEQKFIKK